MRSSVSAAPASVVRRLRELAVVSVAALAVLTGLVTASEAHARVAYTPELDRLLLADRGLDHFSRGLLDQETAVRGYVVSGAEPFLEPYEFGRDEMLRGSALLAAGLRDEAGLRMLDDVQRRATAWQQNYAAPTVALARADLDAAGRLTQSEHGKRLFDAYRAAYARLDAHVAGEIDAVRARRDHVRLSLLSAALGLLALFGVVGGRRLRATREMIESPVRHLTERALAGAAGRPLPDPVPVPLELAPLQDVVEAVVADLTAARRESAERAERIARAGRVTGLLLEQTRLLAATSDAPRIAATTGESALALLGGLRVAVWVDGPDGADGAVLSYESGWHGVPGLPERLGGGSGAATRALHFGRVFVDDDPASPRVAAPMISEGRALGVVEVVLPAGRRPDAGDLDALQVLLSQGAGALTSARLLASTRELSRRDPLTGLPNRRQLELDLAEVPRDDVAETGLLVLDVDHFKRFNDTQGHVAGDDLLRALADVLQSVVRGGDTVYRYGGEEFVVLLRRCQPDALAASAERLRETVARRLLVHGVTVSVGAASGAASPVRDLFPVADEAMYRAKSAGRNRTVVAGDVPASPGSVADPVGAGR